MALTALNTDALVTTEVRTLLGEPVARRISDAEIVRWINQGFNTIQRRNLATQATAIIDADNTSGLGSIEYAIADCLGVKAVIYTGEVSASSTFAGATGHALLRMHPRHFSNIRASTAGVPQEYAWYNGKLLIWPRPDTAENDKLLKVFYYRADVSFGGDDFGGATGLREHYHVYLVWYAFSMALDKLGKVEQAFQYMSYFNNFIDYHKQVELSDSVDSNDMMKLVDRTQFV